MVPTSGYLPKSCPEATSSSNVIAATTIDVNTAFPQPGRERIGAVHMKHGQRTRGCPVLNQWVAVAAAGRLTQRDGEGPENEKEMSAEETIMAILKESTGDKN